MRPPISSKIRIQRWLNHLRAVGEQSCCLGRDPPAEGRADPHPLMTCHLQADTVPRGCKSRKKPWHKDGSHRAAPGLPHPGEGREPEDLGVPKMGTTAACWDEREKDQYGHGWAGLGRRTNAVMLELCCAGGHHPPAPPPLPGGSSPV